MSLTEIKKKGKASGYLGHFSHLFSAVDKTNRFKAGAYFLIKDRLARNIKDWSAVNKRMLLIELNLIRYKVVIIAVNFNDDMTTSKDDHDEKLN